jgi:isopenicillin N synthase-like dioxygenase
MLPVITRDEWNGIRDDDRVARRILAACEDPGAFLLEDHGIPAPIVEAAVAAATRFFARPAEEKLRIHFRFGGYHRGYVPARGERSDPGGAPDLKEAFDCGLELPPTRLAGPAGVRVCTPNQWPDDPAFRPAIEAYLHHAALLATRLFTLVARGLGIPPDSPDARSDEPIAQLRLLRYSAMRATRTGTGIGAHCDYECLTLLLERGSPGLEIDRRGRWHPVAAPPEGCIVLAGEMLGAWSGGRSRAARHQVIRTAAERTVLALFFGPNPDVPLAGAAGGAESAGDFLMRRLKEDQHV